MIFQTLNSVRSNSPSLKYQRFIPSCCKDIGIRKFVAKIQFLSGFGVLKFSTFQNLNLKTFAQINKFLYYNVRNLYHLQRYLYQNLRRRTQNSILNIFKTDLWYTLEPFFSCSFDFRIKKIYRRIVFIILLTVLNTITVSLRA